MDNNILGIVSKRTRYIIDTYLISIWILQIDTVLYTSIQRIIRYFPSQIIRRFDAV